MQSHPPSAGIAQWGQDERGNILMLFALLAPVILGIVGIALDYGRAHTMQARLKSAADSVAIAAASAVGNGSTLDDARALADNLWAGNAANSRATNVVPSIAITNTDGIVNVSVSYTAKVDGLLSRLVGLGGIALNGGSAAEVALADVPTIEAGTRHSSAGQGSARRTGAGCGVDGLQELALQTGLPVGALCAELGLDGLESAASGEPAVAAAGASLPATGCAPQISALPQSQQDELNGLLDLLRQIWPADAIDLAQSAPNSGCASAAGGAQVRLVK